jgi:hypothetical protein
MGWRDTTLTIANGQTESAVLDLSDDKARRIKNLNFFTPSFGVVVTLHLAPSAGGTFAPLNDGFGNNYTLQSSSAQILAGVTAGALKLVAASAVTGDKVVTIKGAAQE